MSRKTEYQKFLRSDFWLCLSATKKQSVGKCEKCGRTERLQAHHLEYPKDWFQTTLDQLMVLCRWCHAKIHGKVVYSKAPKYLIFRDDVDFSRII